MEINRIYNMDCVAGLKMLDSGSVDLTVTSPPYDDLRNYNGFQWDFEEVARQLFRVTKDGGVVVWIVGDKTVKGSETGTSFKQALYFKEVGFNLHDTMIYEKDSISFPETNRYSQIFEFMFVLSKGKPKTVNIIKDRKNKWYDGKKKIKGKERQPDGTLFDRRRGNLLKEYGSRFNIWRFSAGYGKSSADKIAYKHPAIFPEKLANDHIITWSNEGDLILDPFMGSGTTAKMAKLNNRDYIGFELSNEYCNIAGQRLADLEIQTMII
jgi:DNA modification methylase